jgi:hypothetical protein
MRHLAIATVAALAAWIAARPGPAPAQQHHGGSEPAVAGAFAPRVGDLMILQQIRHAKLWFAAAANNWELAEHELDGLKDTFEDLARLYPIIRQVPVVQVVGSLVEGELGELGKAVAAQDRFRFTVAYGGLTAACNACHQATQHAFIVIQQPISPPFNNQSFAPAQQDSSAPRHPH